MKNEPNKDTNNAWIIDESKCLSIAEVRILRNFCKRLKNQGLRKGKFTSVRNGLMIELGLHAGLRVAEMTSLRHGDLYIAGSKSTLVVTGKGKKKRSVRISSEFKKTIKTYNQYKKDFGYETHEDAYLLNNLHGTRISKRALQKFLKQIIEKAGISSHYSIHCLRHTYATFLLYASNHNYRFAQQQLGHASIKTTQVYASIIESEGKKAVEKLYK